MRRDLRIPIDEVRMEKTLLKDALMGPPSSLLLIAKVGRRRLAVRSGCSISVEHQKTARIQQALWAWRRRASRYRPEAVAGGCDPAHFPAFPSVIEERRAVASKMRAAPIPGPATAGIICLNLVNDV